MEWTGGKGCGFFRNSSCSFFELIFSFCYVVRVGVIVFIFIEGRELFEVILRREKGRD